MSYEKGTKASLSSQSGQAFPACKQALTRALLALRVLPSQHRSNGLCRLLHATQGQGSCTGTCNARRCSGRCLLRRSFSPAACSASWLSASSSHAPAAGGLALAPCALPPRPLLAAPASVSRYSRTSPANAKQRSPGSQSGCYTHTAPPQLLVLMCRPLMLLTPRYTLDPSHFMLRRLSISSTSHCFHRLLMKQHGTH